jgi:hypothetical protein
MGLTGKILLFVATLVVLLVGGTLAFTTVQADRLARSTIDAGLQETREVWQAIQADGFNKLRLGVRVLANDPYFKAALAERDRATTLDSLAERGQDLAADFMLATDGDGVLVARTDRPSATGDDLSGDPIVGRALEGEDSSTPGARATGFTAVAAPMDGPRACWYATGSTRRLHRIRRLTRSEISSSSPRLPARLAASAAARLPFAAVSPPEIARSEAPRDRPAATAAGVRILSGHGEDMSGARAPQPSRRPLFRAAEARARAPGSRLGLLGVGAATRSPPGAHARVPSSAARRSDTAPSPSAADDRRPARAFADSPTCARRSR